MVTEGKTTQVDECQGQRQKKMEMDLKDTFDLFKKSKGFMWILEGKIAYALFSFTSFMEFSGFD